MNIGETPLYLRDEESDNLYYAREMKNWEDYGMESNCPRIFEKMKDGA